MYRQYIVDIVYIYYDHDTRFSSLRSKRSPEFNTTITLNIIVSATHVKNETLIRRRKKCHLFPVAMETVAVINSKHNLRRSEPPAAHPHRSRSLHKWISFSFRRKSHFVLQVIAILLLRISYFLSHFVRTAGSTVCWETHECLRIL